MSDTDRDVEYVVLPAIPGSLSSHLHLLKWLEAKLRQLGQFEDETKFHLFKRVAPFTQDFLTLQRVVDRFGIVLVWPAICHVQSLTSIPDIEDIKSRVLSALNTYFDRTSSSLRELKRTLERSMEDGSEGDLQDARMSDPVMEVFDWLDYIAPENILLYLSQYMHVVEELPELDEKQE